MEIGNCLINEFSLAAIDLLLDAGFDINAQKRDEETPLLVALSKGLVEKAKHLIERGAKLTIVAKDGNLIHYAIKGNSIGNIIRTIVIYLLFCRIFFVDAMQIRPILFNWLVFSSN